MSDKHTDEQRVWQYRIKYAVDGCVMSNYRYYQAVSAHQAMQFQQQLTEAKQWNLKTISIQRWCPWSDQWIDETNQIESLIETDNQHNQQ